MSRISNETLRKLVEMRQPGQFTHETNSNYDSRKGSPIQGHVVTYTPDPKKNADGTTSYGWIFPCLVATDLLSDAGEVLESVAAQLNAAPQLAAEVLQLREEAETSSTAMSQAWVREAKAIAERDAALDACNQARLAFAGYVSAESAIEKLDAALSAPVMDAVKQGDAQ